MVPFFDCAHVHRQHNGVVTTSGRKSFFIIILAFDQICIFLEFLPKLENCIFDQLYKISVRDFRLFVAKFVKEVFVYFPVHFDAFVAQAQLFAYPTQNLHKN